MPARDRERVTVVIESEVVRLVGVTQGRVSRWGSAPLPTETVDSDGIVAAPVDLAQVLERLWATQGHGVPVPRNEIVLAIPGRYVMTRLIPLAPDEAGDHALLAVRAAEVVAEQPYYHAWQVVGQTSGRPSLFVVAAPAALVESYVGAAARAGLGLAAVDVKPLALIRAVGQRHAVIVDAERSLVTIIIVDEGLPRRVRFQPLVAPLLTSPEDKIMRIAEVLHEAMQPDDMEASGVVLHPAVPLFLTGSLADHVLLRAVAREVLRHPIGELAPPIELPPEMPVSQFMANVGLAQKQV
jgi:hypothetical protein